MSNKGLSRVWLLTTIDNPFNPHTEWLQWYAEDIRLGHDTCGLVGRLSGSSNHIDDESDYATMTQIIEYNFSGKHVMVSESTWSDVIKAATL
jgi:hypothetical protein